jgi:hypothetical protein
VVMARPAKLAKGVDNENIPARLLLVLLLLLLVMPPPPGARRRCLSMP